MDKAFFWRDRYLKQIFESLQDGIIIMNQSREILLMNPAAERLTGWQIGSAVPYCSYCQSRKIEPNEKRCYLIENDEVPYFLSEMPTYHGESLDVEMSTALMYQDEHSDQKEYLLVLRDQSIRKQKEEARTSKYMIKKLIEAKEDEHKRLAQELHDGVGQSLFSISVALQAIESYVHDARLDAYLTEVRSELEKVMSDVKSYSYKLRPQSLDRLGLVATIRSLITTTMKNDPDLQIEFNTNLVGRCYPLVEINLYRVIQEALHNIIKYAHASKVSIALDMNEEGLKLHIQDNGIGFRPNKVGEGLGLKHMEERVDQLGGKFMIESTENTGTQIKITVPKWKEDIDD
ncbi:MULTISPECIES: PAS domain-containing sensor histidine kinase [unclassified Virgibacillus]|uniref:PAS domain-containing sensor histidine kinase n=1 Tax=unclassified Virgibacillus TaxID=2620237 RepID=UPI0024DE6668|nr:PAS domain-containing sensor histidine kinase [Virgibacillus sp. LDC-1]